MADPITPLDPERIKSNLDEVRAKAGADVEILIATKYVLDRELDALSEAGVELVGENRLQDLERKQQLWGDRFRWDFIGTLQSRKVRKLGELVNRIHSVATWSALDKLAGMEGAVPDIYLQVNVASEHSKAGFEVSELEQAVQRCPVRPAGLMTMPPWTGNAEDNRAHFARLSELAATQGLSGLSMGTSQDWEVAVDEGATIIRLGSAVLR